MHLHLRLGLGLSLSLNLNLKIPPFWVIARQAESALLCTNKTNTMKAQRQIPTVREVRRVPLWPELKIDQAQPIPEPYKITFQVQNGVEFVDPLTVTHLEAKSNYTLIHQLSGRRIMISKTLKVCVAVFPSHFLRIHQSFLINPQYIQTYLRHDNAIRLDNGETLPVSRSGKEVIQEFVKKSC